MKKVIKLKLSAEGIENAITELQMYKEDVERRVKLLVEKLADRGADIVRAKITELDAIDTGVLLNSVESCLVDNIGYIRVNAEYGIFVEFGTGIVGKGKQHPAKEVFDWEYDINEHGEKGWHFPADDGSYPVTKGQPSRPFMYETALRLRDEFPAIVKEVFG